MRNAAAEYVILLAAATAWAVPRSDIFVVDGLAVDELEEQRDTPHFRTRLPRFPLSDISRVGLGLDRLIVEDEPAISIQHGKAGPHVEAANRYINRQEWEKALLELHDALAIEPKNLSVIRLIAAVSSIVHDYETAELYYQKYLEAYPEDADYLSAYANVLLRQGKTDQAEAVLDRLEGLGRRDLMYRFNRTILDILKTAAPEGDRRWNEIDLYDMAVMAGWLLADRKDFEQVLGPDRFARLCRRVFGLADPADLDELNETLRLYQQHKNKNEWDRALEKLVALRERGVYNRAWRVQEALCLFGQGRRDEAIRRMRALLDEFPRMAYAWYRLGLMYTDLEEHGKASEALYNAYSIEPNNALFRFSLAGSYAIQEQYADAWTLIVSVAEDKPRILEEWLLQPGRFRDALARDLRFPDLCRRLGIPPELE